MASKQEALQAGREVGDIIVLMVDEIPNRQQLSQLVTEGFQAAMAVAGSDITGSQRAAVLSHIGQGVLERLNEKVAALQLTDPIP